MEIKDADNTNLSFKYLHYISILFVLSFILSNILAVKIAEVHGFQMPSGMVIFPLSYIFSDILTEVYGFKRARQLIWFAIICEIAVVIFSKIAIGLPPSVYWQDQEAFEKILGPEWRIVISSCIAYLLGDITNCNIIAKLKVKYANRFVGLRFIGSTAVGVLIDNSVFTLLAFTGILPYKSMFWLVAGQYIIKVAYETAMAPISVSVCNWLKIHEGVDAYDINTKFSTFKFKTNEH